MGIRVYYLDDIPTPYRLGVFKLIGKRFDGVFKVGYCASEESGRSWDLDFSGIDFEFLKGWQFRPPFQINPFSFKVNFSVIRALSLFKPDVVILSGYSHPTIFLAAIYCGFHKIPFSVVSETNAKCSETKGFRFFLKKILVYPIVKNMTFSLPTGKMAEEYFKILGADKKCRYYYFPNTPDLTLINNAYNRKNDCEKTKWIRRKFSIDTDKKTILFVGRFIPAKNPIELLNAFFFLDSEIKCSVELIFVGAGELEREIKRISKDEDNIHVIPWLENPEDIYDLMCHSDVFVLPSIHEPWGAVVNEAMAAGCCTIVSDKVGAGYELIEHGKSGFIYTSSDISKLTELLALVLGADDLSDDMSNKSRQSAEKNDQRFAANNFNEAINAIDDYVNK